jgi:hypothetical protein
MMREIYFSLDFADFYAIRKVLPTIFLHWTAHLDLLCTINSKTHKAQGKRKIQ